MLEKRKGAKGFTNHTFLRREDFLFDKIIRI